MALSIGSLVKKESKLPPRTLVYGPSGIGKTTLANEFPSTIFLQTEQGENTTSPITTFDGVVESYDDVMNTVYWLYQNEHDFQNLAIDTIDRLEPLILQKTLDENGLKEPPSSDFGIFGGKVRDKWDEFLFSLNKLRTDRGMCVTLIGHSEIERFDDPRSVSYNRFDFALGKRPHALVQHEMDLIVFLNHDPGLKQENLGYNKNNTRTIAAGGSNRWMYLQGRPSFEAKNRYDMPDSIPYVLGRGYEALAQYLPHTHQTAA